MDTNLENGLKRVLKLKQDGQLSSAQSVCEQLVQSSQRAPEAVHFLGLILKQQGQVLVAEKLIRESISMVPERADYHANLANLLVNTQRHAEAERSYRKALDCDPGFRPARLALARLLVHAQFDRQAKAEAETLLKQDANDVEALVVLGDAERGLKNPQASLLAYRNALSHNPNDLMARHKLGSQLSDLNQGEAALEQFYFVRKAGAQGPQLDASIARTLAAMGEAEEAESQLVRSIQQYPQVVDNQVMLAKIRYMRGSEDFACYFREAAAQFRSQPHLQHAYAVMLRGAHQYQMAQSALEQALLNNPNQADLLAELATVQQLAGDSESAYQSAYKACELEPKRFALSNHVIDPLLSLGRLDEALSLIQEARKLFPKHQWYIAAEATVARLRGDPHYHYLYDYERFVSTYELDVPDGWSDAAGFNRDLARTLNQMHHFKKQPLDQSLRHGSQTSTSLLTSDKPVIQALLGSFKRAISAYREAIGHDPVHPLISACKGSVVFAGCWSVRLGRQGYHVNHVHSQGTISSAYYVTVPAECANTHTQAGWLKLGEPAHSKPKLEPEHFVQPRSGQLTLFPSYMWHGTQPIMTDEPRLSVAFDVVFKPEH